MKGFESNTISTKVVKVIISNLFTNSSMINVFEFSLKHRHILQIKIGHIPFKHLNFQSSLYIVY